MHGLIWLCIPATPGAAVSLLSTDVWRNVRAMGLPIVLQEWTGKKLVGVNGTPLCVEG